MSAHLKLVWDGRDFRQPPPSYRALIDAAHRHRDEALARFEAQESRRTDWRDYLAVVGIGLCIVAVMVIATTALVGGR